MEKNILPTIKKNAMILTAICALAVIFLYAIGHFTDLHPDAYRDLIRSILFGYGIYVLIQGLYHGVYNKFPSAKVKRGTSVHEGQKNTTFTKVQKRNSAKHKKETPLEAICVTFTVITLLNSIMMLTGLDTPKEGAFAYIHMMTRILIITGIIGIWMWKDVIEGAKNITLNFTIKSALENFYHDANKHTIKSISKVFTLITAAYCIIIIAFQSIINPSGGTFFYQSLLGILAFVTIAMFPLRISTKR